MNKMEIEQLKGQLILQTKSKGKFVRIIIILIAIVYTIMPVDLIPDAIPFIGTVDDMGVWLLNIKSYLKEIKKNKELIESILVQFNELLEREC
jgi:uncharacterized membrane protein YkvA (DUF1232 family)